MSSEESEEQVQDAYSSQDVTALCAAAVKRGLDTSAAADALRSALREADAVASWRRPSVYNGWR